MMMAKRACGSEMRVFAGATDVMVFFVVSFSHVRDEPQQSTTSWRRSVFFRQKLRFQLVKIA